jgi:hypothetical protein
MGSRLRVSTIVVLAALAAAMPAVFMQSAQASAPPWEPDPNAQAPYGSVLLYDSAGNYLTGGSNLNHIADYAAASTPVPAADNGSGTANKATLFFANPDPSNPTAPDAWPTSQQSGSKSFPNSSAPAPITGPGFANPVVTLTSSEANLSSAIGGFTVNTATGYANVYQVRIYDSGAGATGSSPHYWESDLLVDPVAGTWSQIYPVITAPTWKPVLYGPHRIGLTDSCLASFDNANTVSYAWYINSSQISGVTSSSYKPPEGYYGMKLSCAVMATNLAGQVTGTSLAYTLGVGPALIPTVKPYLYHGTNKTTATHGTYEYVYHGTWSPTATSYSYQWYVGTTAIKGATSYRYIPPSAYIGKYIYCVVTAKRLHWTNGVYKTASVKVI